MVLKGPEFRPTPEDLKQVEIVITPEKELQNPEVVEDEVVDVEKIPSTEDKEVDRESQERAMETGFIAMREVLKGIDDYVLFASGAAYLFGRKNNISELSVAIPRDVDIAVKDIETLNNIRERLGNMNGVTFEDDGKYKTLGKDDVQVLAGEILVGYRHEGSDEIEKMRVPFEIFQNSRLLTDDVVEHTTEAAGLRILNMEGLQKQVYNNLKFETRVGQGVEEVAEFLATEEIEERLKTQILEVRKVDAEVEEMLKSPFSETEGMSPLTKEEYRKKIIEEGEQRKPKFIKETLKRLEITQNNLDDFYKKLDEHRHEQMLQKVEDQFGKMVELLHPEIEKDIREELAAMDQSAAEGKNDVIPPKLDLMMQANNVNLEQMRDFMNVVDRLREEDELDIPELAPEVTGVLTGGLKTKIPKRQKDLEKFQRLRKQEIGTSTEEVRISPEDDEQRLAA